MPYGGKKLRKLIIDAVNAVFLLTFFSPAYAIAAPITPVFGEVNVEVNPEAHRIGHVILSASVTNSYRYAICLETENFPLVALFHPSKIWNVSKKKAGWVGVNFGEPDPNQLGQLWHTVILIKPHETVSGSAVLSDRLRFVDFGKCIVELNIKYRRCSHLSSDRNAKVLTLRSSFDIPQNWPGVKP